MIRLFANKIRIRKYASVEDNVRGFHSPVQNVQDLHDFHQDGGPSPLRQIPGEPDNEWFARRKKAKEAYHTAREQFADLVPHGLRPLLDELPKSYWQQKKDAQTPGGPPPPPHVPLNSMYEYGHAAMENVYGRLKHMNPTHGEMGLLSHMMRGWNADSRTTGGQYLSLIANQLGGRDAHENMRLNSAHGSPEEQKAMHQAMIDNPMHERMKSLVGELSKQSQEDFIKKHGANGRALHRGLQDNNGYVQNMAKALDEGHSLKMNPLTSYTAKLPAAAEFGDHLLSSHVKPQDVFLTHSVVGTPDTHAHDRTHDEGEIWVKPNKNMPHALFKENDSYYGNRGNLSVHTSPGAQSNPGASFDWGAVGNIENELEELKNPNGSYDDYDEPDYDEDYDNDPDENENNL